mmetsp:Transcript_107714/g.343810  ORF Transcript_107714/g.343810 Transcript_107714/m.343810 type:complete len:236 (-) Transcript_107714:1229-1936(-)
MDASAASAGGTDKAKSPAPEARRAARRHEELEITARTSKGMSPPTKLRTVCSSSKYSILPADPRTVQLRASSCSTNGEIAKAAVAIEGPSAAAAVASAAPSEKEAQSLSCSRIFSVGLPDIDSKTLANPLAPAIAPSAPCAICPRSERSSTPAVPQRCSRAAARRSACTASASHCNRKVSPALGRSNSPGNDGTSTSRILRPHEWAATVLASPATPPTARSLDPAAETTWATTLL